MRICSPIVYSKPKTFLKCPHMLNFFGSSNYGVRKGGEFVKQMGLLSKKATHLIFNALSISSNYFLSSGDLPARPDHVGGL